ncbi:hypothetical protein [Streptomyces yangpuensis]|uniref:hypothetical protein n=1 Tax=Streptomyces yangpuensis TaxID=1648182 RepID=UPI003653532E
MSLWYSEEIMKEQRAAGPDSERLRTLQVESVACAADLETLENAGPEEVDEIAARYVAWVREPGGQ